MDLGKAFKPTGIRQPNRSAHEKIIADISNRIASSEDRRRFLQDRLRGLRNDLSECRTKKDTITEERSQVENQLAEANKEVNEKSANMQRLRSNIPYLSEERINDQIKTLEDMVSKHHYKRSEENKIIQEVNRLKKSKKLLMEYNRAKTSFDNLKKLQRQIRERRDVLFKERGEIKKREDALKRDLNEIRTELEKLKSSIDELYTLRRQSISEFKQRENEYRKHIAEKKEEMRIRRKEEQDAFRVEKEKEREEILANIEPYQEELTLLSNLISYCHRFDVPSTPTSNTQGSVSVCNGFLTVPGSEDAQSRRGSHESNSTGGFRTPNSAESSKYATPMNVTPATTPGVDFKELGFLYKKDSLDDELFPGVPKKKSSSRRNSKMERKGSKAKPLTHNPEVYAQFDQFGLKPPSNRGDVEGCLKALKEKQVQFEKLVAEVKAVQHKDSLNIEEAVNRLKLDPPRELNVPLLNIISSSPKHKAYTNGHEESGFLCDKIDEQKALDENNSEEAFPSLPVLQNNSQSGEFFVDVVKNETRNEKDTRKAEGKSLINHVKSDAHFSDSVACSQEL